MPMTVGDPARKPPIPMESRQARSLHYTPSEWQAIAEEARRRGLEPSVFARMLSMYALSIVRSPGFGEASVAVPLGVLSEPRRARRF